MKFTIMQGINKQTRQNMRKCTAGNGPAVAGDGFKSVTSFFFTSNLHPSAVL